MSEEALRRWYWAGVIVAALALWVPWLCQYVHVLAPVLLLFALHCWSSGGRVRYSVNDQKGTSCKASQASPARMIR
jgi:hypothetical protein